MARKKYKKARRKSRFIELPLAKKKRYAKKLAKIIKGS
jgi:hypothetical protein